MKNFFITLFIFSGIVANSQIRYINVADSITIDSTVDISSEVQGLIDNAVEGTTIYFPTWTYLVSTQINVNKKIYLVSDQAVLKTTSNVTIFYLTAEYSRVTGFNFKGDGKASGKTLQYGIRFSNGGIHIENCNFFDFGGEGMQGAFSAAPKHGAVILNCDFKNNNVGLNIVKNAASEYMEVIGGLISYNNTGLRIGAGNTIINAAHIDYNSIGIEHVASTNDGHGMIIGVSMNHCNTAYKADSILNGMDLIGCKIYGSNIYLEDNKGIRFKNCGFRQVAVTMENNVGCSFDDSQIDTTGGIAFTPVWVGSDNYVRFKNSESVTGNLPASITRSSDYTLTEIDNDILADGNISITLPAAYKKYDAPFTITNIGSATVTVVGTVGGEVNPTLVDEHSYITIKSDGENYRVISRSPVATIINGGAGPYRRVKIN